MMIRTHRNGSITAAAATVAGFLALSLSGSAATAGSEGLRAPQRRAELLPIYQRLKADPNFQARERQIDLRDRAQLEAWLRELPISPLDFLEIDMLVRRYEIAVPRFIHEQHQRWLVLHSEEARRLYG
ncbi:MAG TPA: hypothetical protein VI942_06595, partial [Thermoanaerobaculia bacterium]|nr:hypothetical protein [Thermoanaerobaculia bacterium]